MLLVKTIQVFMVYQKHSKQNQNLHFSNETKSQFKPCIAFQVLFQNENLSEIYGQSCTPHFEIIAAFRQIVSKS